MAAINSAVVAERLGERLPQPCVVRLQPTDARAGQFQTLPQGGVGTALPLRDERGGPALSEAADLVAQVGLAVEPGTGHAGLAGDGVEADRGAGRPSLSGHRSRLARRSTWAITCSDTRAATGGGPWGSPRGRTSRWAAASRPSGAGGWPRRTRRAARCTRRARAGGSPTRRDRRGSAQQRPVDITERADPDVGLGEEAGDDVDAAAGVRRADTGAQPPPRRPFGQLTQPRLGDPVEPHSGDTALVEPEQPQPPHIARVLPLPAAPVQELLDPPAGVDDQPAGGQMTDPQRDELLGPGLLGPVQQRRHPGPGHVERDVANPGRRREDRRVVVAALQRELHLQRDELGSPDRTSRSVRGIISS